jgi:hypothetical protein
MSDLTRLIELKRNFAGEFKLPEHHSTVAAAARAELRIESLIVRLAADDISSEAYIAGSKELSSVEEQLAQIRFMAPQEPIVVKVSYCDRLASVCERCGHVQPTDQPVDPPAPAPLALPAPSPASEDMPSGQTRVGEARKPAATPPVKPQERAWPDPSVLAQANDGSVNHALHPAFPRKTVEEWES